MGRFKSHVKSHLNILKYEQKAGYFDHCSTPVEICNQAAVKLLYLGNTVLVFSQFV